MYSRFRQIGTILILAFGMGLVLNSTTYGQARGFSGKVTNAQGELIVKAKVRLVGITSKRAYDTETDKKGQWTWMNLPSGSYYVVVRAPGYNPKYEQRDAALGLTEINMVLEPGNPDQKLPFELSPEELAKLRKEQEEYQQEAKRLGEIKQFFDAGRTAMAQNDFPAAIEQFKKALEKLPNESTVLANLADAYFKNNQNQEALDAYQKAIAAKPTPDAALLTNIGVVYGRMGKAAESKEAFQKAATLDPANAAQNFYNVGAIMVNNGQAKEAAEAFR
jgi:tetratricopeptide (TPR) repeat protein